MALALRSVASGSALVFFALIALASGGKKDGAGGEGGTATNSSINSFAPFDPPNGPVSDGASSATCDGSARAGAGVEGARRTIFRFTP